MKSKRKVFLVLLIGLSLFFIAITHTAFGGSIRSSLEKTFGVLMGSGSKSKEAESFVKEEDANFLSRLSGMEALRRENSALRDQFQTQNPQSRNLLPSKILGRLGFLGGVATQIVLNKGQEDGIGVGQGVVVKNVVIGKITKVSNHFSIMSPLSSKGISIRAKTTTGTESGIVKGDLDSSITLNNIVVSEKLKKNDLVVTAGDVDENGLGFPPDLVIGKIVSIEKKPSALFQTAKLESPVKIENLETVFILKNI